MSQTAVKVNKGGLREFLSKRQHPVKILGYTSKTLWLLLIPIAKNLVASNFDIQGWLQTYWLDLFTVLAIVGIAVFRWLFVFYEMEEGGITAHTGPFGLIQTTIYFSQITAVRTEQSMVYRSVHASTIHLETQARSLGRSEIKLVISEKNVEEIFSLIASRSDGHTEFSVQSRNRLVLIYSLMFSSFLSGLIIFATIVWQASRVVGSKLKDIAADVNSGLSKVDHETLRLSESVPRLILIVGGGLALGWLMSFVTTLLDNWNFTAVRRGGQLFVRSGKYKRNRSTVNRGLINYYDIRQSLLMKLARISSVHIQCSGYGKSKRRSAALIPMTKNSEMAASMRLLEPDMGSQRSQITPGKGSLKVFIGIPAVISLIPLAAGSAMKLILPDMSHDINVFIVVLTVPLVWFTVVQGFACGVTSAGMTSDTCTICSCPRYQFHKVIIPMKNITMIKVEQNPIQKAFGSCTLTVCADSEKKLPHRVSRLPYDQVCEMLAQYVDIKFLAQSQSDRGDDD